MYTCSKTQNCIITLKTRKNCQYCRFRLCEKAGMKRSWVLADSDCKTAKVSERISNVGRFKCTDVLAFSDTFGIWVKCHLKQWVRCDKSMYWELSKLSL